jgi:RNA polymerase sigma factor (sigma-70 family)
MVQIVCLAGSKRRSQLCRATMIAQGSMKSFCRTWPKPIVSRKWLTGNAYDAEDVVQDAALRAFRGIKSFGAVNARAWSLTIVRNTAYSWLRKNKSKAVAFTDDLSPAEQQKLEHEGLHGTRVETPEEIALFKVDAEEVQRALAQLPAQFREVIVLREINQLNYRDIAEITNVPIGTVMSRLSRGRRLLIALRGDRK